MNNARCKNSSKKNGFNLLLDDLFNLSISDFIGSDFVTSQPAVNIFETKEAYEMELAAPGLRKEIFDISIHKNQLSISAHADHKDKPDHTEDAQKEKVNYKRREFGYQNFKRTFKLPETVDQTKIDANYINGVLKLTLSKKIEAKEELNRTIEIK